MSEQYTKDSIVNRNKQKIDDLVNGHWNYIEQLLMVSCEPGQTFTFAQVMRIREFDYKSVAKHFYKHGWEAAVIA